MRLFSNRALSRFSTYDLKLKSHLLSTLQEIREAGTFKEERVITSAQDSSIRSDNKEVLNFCSNNYLGMSNHPVVVAEAMKHLESHGFGLSSVRFICGT